MPLIDKGSAAATAGARDYRYYGNEGVPFYGQAPLLTADEYATSTTRVGLAGYGVFNVAEPSQMHFGRTLRAVLEKCRLGEFELVRMVEYNNGVVSSPDQPPAVFVYVVWFENTDMMNAEARKYAQTSR